MNRDPVTPGTNPPSGVGRVASPQKMPVGSDSISPDYLVDAAWREIAVAVPAAVAIGPVQAPIMGVGAVSELGDAHLRAC